MVLLSLATRPDVARLAREEIYAALGPEPDPARTTFEQLVK